MRAANAEHRSTFAPHKQYRSIHGKAHRKAAARVAPPALTRHLAFWLPPATATEVESFEQRRNRWIADIDWFLMSMLVEAYYEWKRSGEAVDYMPISFNVRRMSHASEGQAPQRLDERVYDGYFFRHRGYFVEGSDRRPQEIKLRKMYSEGGEENAARFETVSLRFYYNRIPVKVRAELHSEFCTLSFTASFDTPKDKLRDQQHSPCDAILKSFETLNDVMEVRHARSLEAARRPERSKEYQDDLIKIDPVAHHLFKNFWSGFEQVFISPALTPRFSGPQRNGDAPRPAKTPLRHAIGACFLDFRGLVVSLGADQQKGILQKPFEEIPDEPVQDHAKKGAIGQCEALAHIEAIMPLLDRAREVLAPASAEQIRQFGVEYTAVRAHRKRAIYLSSLAPQPVWGSENEPVCYVVITKHRHRWQMGRLIDRLHTAGTFRVASLMDFAKLNGAGFRLLQIEAELDKALQKRAEAQQARFEEEERRKHKPKQKPPKQETPKLSGEERARANKVRKLRQRYEKVKENLRRLGAHPDSEAAAEVTSSPPLEQLRPPRKSGELQAEVWTTWQMLTRDYDQTMRMESVDGYGSLLYRSERSQFYVREFMKEVRALEMKRVEGFQPYDAFVQRKLGPTWEYISSLRERSEGMGRRLEALGDGVRIDDGIAHTFKLRELQEFAEVAATVPIMYYAGHIVEAVLGKPGVPGPFTLLGMKGFEDEKQWLLIGTLAGAVAYWVFLTLFRISREQKLSEALGGFLKSIRRAN